MEIIKVKKIFTNEEEKAEKLINCDNYIGTLKDNNIFIYELNDDLNINLKTSISCNSHIGDIDFNHKYKNLIISSYVNDYLKLWKISDQGKNEIISTLKTSSKCCNHVKFNPKFEKILISSSANKIQIWDITKYTNITDIPIKSLKILKWDVLGIYFAYLENKEQISIHNLDNELNIFTIKDKYIKNFEFKNNSELLTFHDDNTLKIWDIRNYTQLIKTFSNIPYKYGLYDKNNNYILIQKTNFQIYEADNYGIIYNKKIDLENNYILLDNCFLNKNEDINLLEQDKDGNFNIIKIKDNNRPNIALNENIDKSDMNIEKEFIDNIIYEISDLSTFSDYSDKIFDKNYPIKSYMYINQIKDELDTIKSDLLPVRKKYVIEELKKNSIFKDIVAEYLYYIKLIIRDNTNKQLLKKYLNFLKKK